MISDFNRNGSTKVYIYIYILYIYIYIIKPDIVNQGWIVMVAMPGRNRQVLQRIMRVKKTNNI